MSPTRRVLLVEDEPLSRELVRRMLARLGFEVETADDGPAALTAFAAARFDLMVLDRELPSAGGIELTREVRAMEGGARRTPILGITATSSEDDRAAWRAAGVDDLLEKPIQRAALEGVTARLCLPFG